MKLYMMDCFVAEGDPGEIAVYLCMFLDLLKHKEEKENADRVRKEVNIFERLSNMTFNELRKMEMGEDDEE